MTDSSVHWPSLLIAIAMLAGWPRDAPADAAAPVLPDVTVRAPRPPTANELQGEALHDFVRGHAKPTVVTGQLARWEVGLCPQTNGLAPAYNDFVTARILAVAASVGAPRPAQEPCHHNVYVFFTSEPKRLLDEVEKQDARILGFHYPRQTQDLEKMSRPIQGWYVTSTRGVRGGHSIDEAEPLLPLESNILNMGKHPSGRPGSRLGSSISSSIVNVLIIADTHQVAGYEIGAISDYLAMLTLSQTFAPDQCGTLPSIMELMLPNCGDRGKTTAITAGDLAFLSGLYRTDLEQILPLERSNILDLMTHQFRAH
jgi:hypothetical protein